MAKALGVGGIFFKSPDPVKLQGWYAQWLGINVQSEQGMSFAIFQPGMMPENGYTVWSTFDSGTAYFAPSSKEFMFNLVVDNLEEALSQVAAGGAQVVGNIEKSEYGNFGWFIDPNGNKVELWQPPESTMSNEQVAPETKGVTVKFLGTVDLGPEIEGMAGRRLRMRMVTIEPGGVFGPLHDHKDRPGIVYILQGTITDHRNGVATDYGPGVGWPEDRNTLHWLENKGTVPAVEISVDIVRQE